MMEQLSDLARRVGGSLHGADAALERVVSDTRQLRRGDLFVALRGERFDGHDFVLRAGSVGASGALVARAVEGAISQVVVGDSLQGLQDYAASWRADFSLPVIGVTGSSGKTTTKQMLAAVCAARGPALATEGNLNNHIGVPLTLLRLRANQRTAVIEMGANHAGEIAALARIARPDIGIVTQAGDAHLEGFGSRDGVAHAKGEMYSGLQGRGVAVINRDDAYFSLWQKLAGASTILSFGLAESADVHAADVRMQGSSPDAAADTTVFTLHTPQGRARVELPLPGLHNVRNALAAAAAGLALGLEPEAIAAGLGRVLPVAGRLNWIATADGARVLDDSYNANPTSLRAALDVLAAAPGQRWLALGDMRELGGNAAALHEEAGRSARALGIDRVYALGALARQAAEGFGGGGRHFETVEALVEALREDLREQGGARVAVLVKGSRSSRMERVVAALTGRTAAQGEH
jgi:UDP-N-acetylmuramoyl-tripeptide--D-alanyl-D-alanine ligase